MKYAAAVSALAGSALAAPFSLSNGFPDITADKLADVSRQAGGPLPNGALPGNLTKDVQTSLQLVAANEIFETAYFTSLFLNVTNGVPGYECSGADRRFVEEALYRIRAQEELHATGANAILKQNGAQTVGACQYQFPVTTLPSAIKLANTFTDVVLGVLPQVQLQGAKTGAFSLIPLFGAIQEQEAEQVGWFRTLQGNLPSAAPFLSSTSPQFALSAIKMFLVPGSCPAAYAAVEQAVGSFPPLTVASSPSDGANALTYQVSGTIPSGAVLAYISGQSTPLTVAISNVQSANGVTTFTAPFPSDNAVIADGLVIAAVVSQNGSYTNAADVSSKTLFGPGLIEYN